MRITINTQTKRYPVVIETGAIRTFAFPSNAFVITNAVIHNLYGKWFSHFPVIQIPVGEEHKRLQTVEHICEQLITLGAHRNSTIIAVGGGVVGDIAGFVASIFMRGIPVYQVPTTLLAMVDSSVGGKTGVDLAAGKNLVGTFHQPEAVLMDPELLVQLPAEQFSNGMAEVIKHGVLDAALFIWLERHAQKILQRDTTTLQQLLKKNVEIKKAVIEADEREDEIRMLLNLGHTFGHAIEQLSCYTVPHGQAVAIGLVYAAHYAQMPQVDRLINLLQYFGLPTHLETPYPATVMVQAMQSDKKNHGKYVTLVLPHNLGDIHLHTATTPAEIKRFITAYHRNER